MMKKEYDFLTPYEEFDRESEKKRYELTDKEKAYRDRFIELLVEAGSQEAIVLDESKRCWLEEVAYPYFVELAETNFMRVELKINEDGTYGWIICTTLEFTLYDDLWTDWEKLSEIISRTSTVTFSPKENYIVAKFGFKLYEGENKRIEEIMAESRIIRKRMQAEGFTDMFESEMQKE